MNPDKKNLSRKHREIYNRYYCGLCRSLRRSYGITSAIILNYEIVNTLILSEAISLVPFRLMKMSCSFSPVVWINMCTSDNKALETAARVSIILAELEAKDNLVDSNGIKDKLISKFVDSKFNKISAVFLDEYELIKKLYDDYMVLETEAKNGNSGITCEELTVSCGKIAGGVAEIIADVADYDTLELLKRIMCFWGEWTYLMDAVDDYESDKKKGEFNPLFLESRPEHVNDILEQAENRANHLMDNLKFVRNGDLIETLFKQQFPKMRKKVCGKFSG